MDAMRELKTEKVSQTRENFQKLHVSKLIRKVFVTSHHVTKMYLKSLLISGCLNNQKNIYSQTWTVSARFPAVNGTEAQRLW